LKALPGLAFSDLTQRWLKALLRKGFKLFELITQQLYESHYVFDILYNNTTDIQPTIHSTDTHGANQVNFAILSVFGYQFAPRYRNIRGKTDTLYGFKPSSEYDDKFLLTPTSKVNTNLILEEEENIQHIFASLALKVTSQSAIISKLSNYSRKNRTKQALWELDNRVVG